MSEPKPELEFYEIRLVQIFPPPPGKISLHSAAFLDCGLCGRAVSSGGGPEPVICVACAEQFKCGALKGCVVWDEPARAAGIEVKEIGNG